MAESYGVAFGSTGMLRLFPTLVWKAQVAPSVRQGIEDDVLAKLDDMRRDAVGTAPGLRWQSQNDLHHLDEFLGLVACIRDSAKCVLKILKPKTLLSR